MCSRLLVYLKSIFLGIFFCLLFGSLVERDRKWLTCSKGPGLTTARTVASVHEAPAVPTAPHGAPLVSDHRSGRQVWINIIIIRMRCSVFNTEGSAGGATMPRFTPQWHSFSFLNYKNICGDRYHQHHRPEDNVTGFVDLVNSMEPKAALTFSLPFHFTSAFQMNLHWQPWDVFLQDGSVFTSLLVALTCRIFF